MMDQRCWNNSDGADVQHVEQVDVLTVFAKFLQIRHISLLFIRLIIH